ncbi:MAG: NAD(P)-dependent oxidoreductase, partial [Erysipelotrichaceae bacterium]|nr:NAD(P)-dependent oxidoreductase [Erysipelotrichaceae bacterium]
MFEKYYKDRQEADLKKFYLPEGHPDFGVDTPDQYGTLRYYDEDGFHEEKVVSVKGDYGYYYDALYETLKNGKPQLVTHEQTLWQLEMLETGMKDLK